MTFSRYSKLAAISTGQLMCAIVVAGQQGINPKDEAMAQFSRRAVRAVGR